MFWANITSLPNGYRPYDNIAHAYKRSYAPIITSPTPLLTVQKASMVELSPRFKPVKGQHIHPGTNVTHL
jgi:hypothetical protein